MAMSASQQPAVASRPHLHLAGDTCPYCEQPIPNERAAEVRARADAKERQVTDAVSARLTQMFALERVQMETNAEARIAQVQNERAAELEHVRANAAVREAAARDEARAAAEAALAERLAEQQRTSEAALASIQGQLAAVQRENAAAAQQLQDITARHQAEIEKRVADARTAAESTMAERLGEQQRVNEAVLTDLQTRLQDVDRQRAEAGEKLAELTANHQAEIQQRVQEARTAAESAAQQAIAEKEQAATARQQALEARLADAEKAKQEAAEQTAALQAAHEAQLGQRLQEQRDALETDKTNALNAANAKYFEETAKLTGKLEHLTRQLEKKTANELGEGAEINLFETLKEAFEGDRIQRVAKGAAGADVIHEIMHNGKVAGVIVYDSKNRNQWRTEYVTKLREDQRAAKAEHAILTTHKFPAEQRQLCVQDGVIIANPARVIALVQMLRRHILQVHTMRLSNSEREKKTSELYDFIRSERCHQLFERIDKDAEALLDLQEQEKKAHDKNWNRQGTLYRRIQKTCGDMTLEIDRIIGTASEDR